MMKSVNYVAYYRVSTLKQGATGLGMQAQQDAIQTFLANDGGRLIAEFTEVAQANTVTVLSLIRLLIMRLSLTLPSLLLNSIG